MTYLMRIICFSFNLTLRLCKALKPANAAACQKRKVRATSKALLKYLRNISDTPAVDKVKSLSN